MKKFLKIVAILLLILVIILGVVAFWWTHPRETGILNSPELQVQNQNPNSPLPEVCPAVELISVAGSWGSSMDDDPLNPHTHPGHVLTAVGQNLRGEFSPEQLRVWTAAYPAEVKSAQSPEQMSMDESSAVGKALVNQELAQLSAACPDTRFLLMGYSQGAKIVGDIISEIGQNIGIVPQEKILSATLLADPRRDHESGVDVSTPVASGEGLEISLKSLQWQARFILPGYTFEAQRAGGFGALNNQTYVICAVGDTVCDLDSSDSSSAKEQALSQQEPFIHASYDDNPHVITGTTVPQWLMEWVRKHIPC